MFWLKQFFVVNSLSNAVKSLLRTGVSLSLHLGSNFIFLFFGVLTYNSTLNWYLDLEMHLETWWTLL